MTKTVRELFPIDADELWGGSSSGNFATLDNTMDLSNKTLTAPVLENVSWTFPTFDDVVLDGPIEYLAGTSINNTHILSGVLTLPNSGNAYHYTINATNFATVSNITTVEQGTRIILEFVAFTIWQASTNIEFPSVNIKHPYENVGSSITFYPKDIVEIYEFNPGKWRIINIIRNTGKSNCFSVPRQVQMYTRDSAPANVTLLLGDGYIPLTDRDTGRIITIKPSVAEYNVTPSDLDTWQTLSINTWFFLWFGLDLAGNEILRWSKTYPSSTFKYYVLLGAAFYKDGSFRKFSQVRNKVTYLEEVIDIAGNSSSQTWQAIDGATISIPWYITKKSVSFLLCADSTDIKSVVFSSIGTSGSGEYYHSGPHASTTSNFGLFTTAYKTVIPLKVFYKTHQNQTLWYWVNSGGVESYDILVTGFEYADTWGWQYA